MNNPFHIKKYKSYHHYLKHQCSKIEEKLSSPHGQAWLKRHEEKYYGILSCLLKTTEEKSKYRFSGKTCLCLGARGSVEVKSFIDLGALAIGIDVAPIPHNEYVVMGDAARIQYCRDSFDIVYTNALDHFLAIDNVLKEITRVLKPNGLFILITGTPNGAKEDEYGSTYWDSEEALEKYLSERYRFKLVGKIDLKKPTGGWFSDYLMLKNKNGTIK